MRAPRLKNFDYKGYIAYSITICCDYKNNYFKSEIVINKCSEILKELSEKFNFKIYLYTFMPDHLHLCVVGESKNSDLIKLIKLFKQMAGHWFKNEYHKKLFQPGYYDHIIRKEEGIEKVMRYIAENPIRQGLVGNYDEFKFTGSFMFDDTKNLFV